MKKKNILELLMNEVLVTKSITVQDLGNFAQAIQAVIDKKAKQKASVAKEEVYDLKNLHKDFVAIDFEAAKGTDPCQIGMAIVKNGEIVKTVNRLIRPQKNAYQNRTIEVHHITPKMTANEPSFSKVWKDIKNDFEDSFIIAHGAGFDLKVLYDSLAKYRLKKPHITGFHDTCKLCNYESLELACARYGIDLEHHHDAEDDAVNCAKLYLAVGSGKKPLAIEDINPDISFKVRRKRYYDAYKKGESKTPLLKLLREFLPQANPKNPFYARRVCITGQFNVDRESLQQWLLNVGADLGGYPDKKSDYLLTGEGASKLKIRIADQLNETGCHILKIDKDELRQIMAGKFARKFHISEKDFKLPSAENNEPNDNLEIHQVQ